MPENVMQKGRKMEPKRIQNGSRNQTKIGKRRKKGSPEIDAKKRCKFEGRKVAKTLDPWSSEGRFWGAGGVGGNGETGFDSDPL